MANGTSHPTPDCAKWEDIEKMWHDTVASIKKEQLSDRAEKRLLKEARDISGKYGPKHDCAYEDLKHVIREATRGEGYLAWKKMKRCKHKWRCTYSNAYLGGSGTIKDWVCDKCGATMFYDSSD